MTDTTLRQWLNAIAVYRDPRVWTIFFLGFSSGLPLALTYNTLTIWLTESQVDRTTIGLFALVGLPYTFKFLWSPLIDALSLPILGKRLGRRRSWAVVSQLSLMVAILLLGASDPATHLFTTALLALLVSFFSASQDIVIDAYRVEILEQRQYGAGAGMIVLGYRIGMLISGAGALYLATYVGWFATYASMAAMMLVGLIVILSNPEPASSSLLEREPTTTRSESAMVRFSLWLHRAAVAPFADFLTRPGWMAILLFIVLYKFGDALAGVMSNPFYLYLGFSKIEIANVSKLFGLLATILGGLAGGVIVSRYGIGRSLLYCGLLQLLSNLLFAVLALAGKSMPLLITAIAFENLSGGMGTAAFVAYLSILCTTAYTATQYALLSSFAAFGRTLLASTGGWLADKLDWIIFFIATTVAALPGLLILVYLLRRFPIEGEAGKP